VQPLATESGGWIARSTRELDAPDSPGVVSRVNCATVCSPGFKRGIEKSGVT